MRLSYLGIGLSLAFLSVSTSAKDKPPPSEPTTKPDWAEVRAKGVAQLTSALFDPSSVIINWSSGFKWGYAKPVIGRRTHGWIACGNYNAKNRLGGYVGASAFWIMADANNTVTYGEVVSTISSCDGGGGPPVNPELIAISPTMASQGPATGVADELEKLAELRDKGIITPAEFEVQKAKLLAR